MAKLTRTQKFADLRENLTNDKEPSLSTKELSGYEDKLSSLTGQTLDENREVRKAPEEDPRYIWTAFEDTPVEDYEIDYGNNFNDGHHSFDSELYVWNDIQEVPHQDNQVQTKQNETPTEVVENVPTYTEPVYNQPVEEVKQETNNIASFYEEELITPQVEEAAPVEPVKEEIKEEVKEEPHYMGLYNSNPEIEAAYEEAEKRAAEEETVNKVEPVKEERSLTDQEIEDILNDTVNIAQQIDDYTEVPLAKQDVETVTYGDHHEVDHSKDEVNHIINETINEVGEYNRTAGEQTISQLTNNMVNEVRRRETRSEKHKFNEVPVSDKKVDDDFSNTVSMEINKIVDEIANTEEIKVPKVEEKKVEEHPVLAKALTDEKEDVVVIKNIAEIEKEETATNTMSGTIPFVVSANDDEDVIEEDDEDSNTILNIILIVLIVILLAVLGLIIFYILKTKGII